MSSLYIQAIKINKDRAGIDYQQYPYTLPVVANWQDLSLKAPVTFLVGENGSGKSTLLEAIAVSFGFNAEGGSKHFNFATKATHSDLFQAMTLVKGAKRPKDGYFLRSESFYNLAIEIDDLAITDAYGERSLHRQSHGESFLALVQNRFFGNGLYLLDEPEAALSPARQLALLALMHNLVQQNSQMIIATHAPILMAYPKAQIYVLKDDCLELTAYQASEHYLLTKQFLNNPEGMLKHLLD